MSLHICVLYIKTVLPYIVHRRNSVICDEIAQMVERQTVEPENPGFLSSRQQIFSRHAAAYAN